MLPDNYELYHTSIIRHASPCVKLHHVSSRNPVSTGDNVLGNPQNVC